MMTLKMIATDWLAVKSHRWRLVVMAAIVALFGVVGMSMIIIPIASYMAVTFSMNAFVVEEKGKLEHLYLSLPLSRKNIVRGRFAFMILLLTVSLAVCGVFVALVASDMRFGPMYLAVKPGSIMLLCSLGFAFAGFVNLCMYPVMFRLGYEKGKIFGFYIPVFVIAGLFGGSGAVLNSQMELILGWLSYWATHTLRVGAILLCIGAGLFFVSYQLSLYLYKKRDL